MVLNVTLIKPIHQCLIMPFLFFSTTTWSKKRGNTHKRDRIQPDDWKMLSHLCAYNQRVEPDEPCISILWDSMTLWISIWLYIILHPTK